MSKKSIRNKRTGQQATKQVIEGKPVESENSREKMIAARYKKNFLPYRRTRKINKRFIIMLAIWIIALVVALIYLSKM